MSNAPAVLRVASTYRRFLVLSVVAAVAFGSCSRRGPDNPSDPPPPMDDGSPRIVLEAGTRFQTMSGWEATAQVGQQDSAAYLGYRDELFDLAVNDLGIDRLRVPVRSGSENSRDYWSEWRAGLITLQQYRAVRYLVVNDDGDPRSIRRSGGFWFAELDDTIEKVVLPMKQRLEALGRRLYINVNYTAFEPGTTYAHQNPEEYAEFVEAVYRHLAERYGLVPDAWEMMLEPDNVPAWNPGLMRQAMVAAGNRLEPLGVTPRFIGPSTTNMGNAVAYADELARGGLPRFWSELSYHRYSGVSESTLRMIAARAEQWNISTGMLEHIGSGYQQLHDDLKIGRVSAWQQFTLAFPGADNGAHYYSIDDSNPQSPRVIIGARTKFLRQYFRYIRQGAVRVAASTSHAPFDPLAFINPDGKYVVVVKASERGSFGVQGLPPGLYEVRYTTASNADVRVGDFAVTPGSTLRVNINDPGVLTIAGTN